MKWQANPAACFGRGKEKGAELVQNLAVLYTYRVSVQGLYAYDSAGISCWDGLEGKTIDNGPPRGAALTNARLLIKLAFRWTRHLRGGPAHAAIVSSAMFGTISGGPIVNVLSTGVLTIPMMLKRGFSKVFAGEVEAAASSRGSIMPPVMGVAAFVLASLTSVPYSSVIIAAIIPAIAYFFCLFLSAVFQSRKQNITAIGKLTDDMHLARQDYLNLLMIFGPIVAIVVLLLTPKDAVGCDLLGGLLGADRILTGAGCQIQSLGWYLPPFRTPPVLPGPRVGGR